VTGEELAAVTAAVNAILQQQTEEPPETPRMPAWRRAMRLEATGNADVR
jgi:hypothetical protein